MLTSLLVATAMLAARPAAAQEYPRAEDVASPEALVLAAYDALSRAPGENFEWDRFRSLHLPSALLVPAAEQRGGRLDPLTVDGFIDWIDGVTEESAPIGSPQDQGFTEEQLHMVKQRYGDVVQIMSTYASRLYGEEEILVRGVNAMTMVFDGNRWWMAAVAWDEESSAGPIPAEYLGDADPASQAPPSPASPAARPDDVASIDALIDASYETLNRAPGDPFQWERYQSLRLPGAILVPNSEQSGGQFAPRTLEDHVAMVNAWYEENVGGPQDHGFAEEEIHRTVNRYGDVAHVESTYVKRLHDSDEILGRGVNFYTLVWDGSRWWISGAAWDEENGAGPIPSKYLP